MFIERLSVKNFKSIEDLTIDFKNLNGLYEISGPVGSGKTAIGEALLFALFGTVKDKTNEDLLRWGQKKAQIYIELESRGHKVVIERELTKSGSKCEVSVDGKPLALSNKRDTQKHLENEIYDISRMTLELLCIISFTGFKSLSNLNAADTKRFLDQTFGLDAITGWATQAFDEKKESSKKKDKIDVDIQVAQKGITLLENQVEVDEVGLNSELDDLRKEYKELSSNQKKEKDLLESELQHLRDDERKYSSELSVIVSKGQDNKKKLDFLAKGICPTCGAPLDQSHLEEYQEERKSLAKEYKEVNQKIEDIRKEMRKQKSEREPLINEFQPRMNEILTRSSEIKTELSHATKAEGDIKELKDTISKNEKELQEVEKEVNDWSELYSYLQNEARQVVLNTRIPHINKCANKYLSKLGQSYRVKLTPSFKVEISNTILNKDFSVSCLSAGQTKMLDMVLILAVLDSLLSKVNFNICFCDELFSNMDADLRDQMCKLLKGTLREGQSMFVICHAPLNKDLMDGTITAQLKNLKSVYQMQL